VIIGDIEMSLGILLHFTCNFRIPPRIWLQWNASRNGSISTNA